MKKRVLSLLLMVILIMGNVNYSNATSVVVGESVEVFKYLFDLMQISGGIKIMGEEWKSNPDVMTLEGYDEWMAEQEANNTTVSKFKRYIEAPELSEEFKQYDIDLDLANYLRDNIKNPDLELTAEQILKMGMGKVALDCAKNYYNTFNYSSGNKYVVNGLTFIDTVPNSSIFTLNGNYNVLIDYKNSMFRESWDMAVLSIAFSIYSKEHKYDFKIVYYVNERGRRDISTLKFSDVDSSKLEYSIDNSDFHFISSSANRIYNEYNLAQAIKSIVSVNDVVPSSYGEGYSTSKEQCLFDVYGSVILGQRAYSPTFNPNKEKPTVWVPDGKFKPYDTDAKDLDYSKEVELEKDGTLANDTGTNTEETPATGTTDLSVITSWLSTFWDNLVEALNRWIDSVFSFNWDNITGAIAISDYYTKFQEKFKLFYDITDMFKNIQEELNDTPPVFTMPMPDYLGGGEVVILDFNSISEPIKWGRRFLRAALWYAFALWVIRKFEPSLSVGG